MCHSPSLNSQDETLRNRISVGENEVPSMEMINGTTNGFSYTFSVISLEEKENLREKWRRKKWRSCVCLVAVGILVSMLMGLDMS